MHSLRISISRPTMMETDGAITKLYQTAMSVLKNMEQVPTIHVKVAPIPMGIHGQMSMIHSLKIRCSGKILI